MLYIFGDTHGQWNLFNSKLNDIFQKNENPANIIVCGDFGFWPAFREYSLDKIKLKNDSKIYFCPGNHEDWNSLDDIEKNSNEKIIEVHKNIFYCTFGSVKDFEGKSFMFCGGAYSVDKNIRTMGYDWFPQETISESDIYKLPEEKKIDVIISHTGPKHIVEKLHPKVFKSFGKIYDPSTRYLESIYEVYQPSNWYFGHFHYYQEILTNKTKFICLDCIDGIRRSNVCF